MSTTTKPTVDSRTLENLVVSQPTTNSGYDYVERLKAPNVCEFYVPTPQGHRIVVVYLGTDNPHIIAFNESDGSRTPATLFLHEINELIDRARKLCSTPLPRERNQVQSQ